MKVLILGLMGAGKSTLAYNIQKRYGIARLNIDEVCRNKNTGEYYTKEQQLEKLKQFEKDNAEILTKIKKVRNKVYSHLDPNWLEDVKNIPFEEIEICINFLNKLFDYNFEKLLGENL